MHSCRGGNSGVNPVTYQTQCWQSIVWSPGFKPNFVAWWPTRPVQLESSPTLIQGFYCALNTLELIFQDFRLNCQHFEDWHRKNVGSWSKPEGKVSQRRSTKPCGQTALSHWIFMSPSMHITFLQLTLILELPSWMRTSSPLRALGLWMASGSHPCAAWILDL